MDQAFIYTTEAIKMEILLKQSDIARLLNISRSFAYHLMQTGAIPTVRMGKSYRVRPRDLQAYIDQNIHNLPDDQ